MALEDGSRSINIMTAGLWATVTISDKREDEYSFSCYLANLCLSFTNCKLIFICISSI
jgi:hypothetical protein